MKRLLLVLMLCLALPAMAQAPEAISANQPDSLLIQPTFKKGGVSRFRNWVMSHLEYPTIMLEDDLSGEVVVSFVVDTTGHIRDITLVESFHPIFDMAVIRCVSESPKWSPGSKEGVPVSVRYTLPVKFKLQRQRSTNASPYSPHHASPGYSGSLRSRHGGLGHR